MSDGSAHYVEDPEPPFFPDHLAPPHWLLPGLQISKDPLWTGPCFSLLASCKESRAWTWFLSLDVIPQPLTWFVL